MAKPYNTRFAPSPTGFAHIGNFRTAYFNWLAARASGGTFLLRIDDTDLDRHVDDAVDLILDTMDWLGMDYDSIMYQSKNIDRYKSIAMNLVDSGLASVIDGGAIALNNAALDNFAGVDSWVDNIGGSIKVTDDIRKKMTGLILMKSNGTPTYNFATVVDDIGTDINYVIRGTDHISNTPKQLMIYHALNATIPDFAHVGLIHYNKKKMSKRDDAASMAWYRDSGYDPDAVLNAMARLGWGPTVDDKSTALLPRDRMLDLFLDGGKMKSSSANMDMAKLDSFNRKYKARKEHAARS